MLKVFLTVDVEIWCGGWDALDRNFPEAFRRYIYGPTGSGEYALPYLLALLETHGLDGVFFVEPLFAGCFGAAPLAEVVGLIRDKRQEIQAAGEAGREGAGFFIGEHFQLVQPAQAL